MTDLPQNSPEEKLAAGSGETAGSVDSSASAAGESASGKKSNEEMTLAYATIHPRRTLMRHIRGRLLAGLVWAIPLFVTVTVLGFIYGLVTKFTHDPALWITRKIFSGSRTEQIDTLLYYLVEPAIALFISLFIVYFLGLLGGFVIGRRILAAGEHFISNLPLIKGIYSTTKQVLSVFRQSAGGQSFQRVVLVEFPRNGTWTIAFVTKTITDSATGEKFTCVFIPMTPNPTSGFFQMFPAQGIRDTDWTVDQGIKIVLSGGLLAPNELRFDRKDAPTLTDTP